MSASHPMPARLGPCCPRWTALVAILAVLGGCASPLALGPAGASGKASLAALTERDERVGPFPRPTEQEAMRAVSPALAEIAEADTDAHRELLERLSHADPTLWEATVEQAKNQLAYRRELSPAADASGTLLADNRPDTSNTNATQTPRVLPNEHADGSRVIPASATVNSDAPATQSAPSPQAETPVPAAPTSVAAFADQSARGAEPKRPTQAYPVTVAPTMPGPPRAAALATSTARRPVESGAVTPVDDDLPAVVGAARPQWIANHHAVEPSTGPSSGTSGSARLASLTQPGVTSLAGAAAPASTDWRVALEHAIAELEAKTSDRPTSIEDAQRVVRLRLLQLAAGRTEDAVAAPGGLTSGEQGYWSNQLYAMSMLLDERQRSDARSRATAATHHQAEASAKLGEVANLAVRNLTLCREVYGFGAYEPAPETDYQPGDQVVLYAEIDHYRSDQDADGFRTTLASRYRLLDREGREAASGDFPVVDDLCLTRRRDFHIQYGVTLPATVVPGEYRLELTVTDQLGGKLGYGDLPVVIGQR